MRKKNTDNFENIQVLKLSTTEVCKPEVKTTNKLKITFNKTPSVRKSSINEKILRFQELSESNDCVIGSGRCATHNLKIVRVIKNVRISEPVEGEGVKWRLRE